MPHVPVLSKGRITVPAFNDGNLSRTRPVFREFMFNPNELDDDKSLNFGSVELPGASHPVYQYGSGGARIIRFELYFDGDRGGVGRGTENLSVKKELEFYQSLLYPSSYDGEDFAAVYPHVVLFSLGNYADAMPCLVTRAPIRVHYWTPKMDPVRATINLELTEVPERSKIQSDIYRE